MVGGSARVLVIGTPIGNLGDLSPRAAEALASCDVIACEDTRRTGRLLQMSGIAAPKLIRLDQHTESGLAQRLIRSAVEDLLVVGLVSDAGMPGLSDPGSIVISAALAAGVRVEVIPGPFAGVVGLIGSGLLGTDSRFIFEGFLSRRSSERRRRLSELRDETRTMVLYESPQRLGSMLGDASEILGHDRRAVVARELTKLHEEFRRATLSELVVEYATVAPKGECVVIIDGAPVAEPPSDDDLMAAHRRRVDSGMTSRDSVAAVADEFGVNANAVKRLVFGKGTGSA
ncbi:MAG: 16S rRNA (cytidine(1402)-2'-O)-methyltransferase [Microthrixaceae bacterium]